jgi:tRNA A37 threonylcarbamoyladenosine dehydratase
LSPERALATVTADYDVLDCIDSITPKLNLIIAAKRKRVKIISRRVQAEKWKQQSKSRRYQ